jgi:hypothetical protein
MDKLSFAVISRRSTGGYCVVTIDRRGYRQYSMFDTRIVACAHVETLMTFLDWLADSGLYEYPTTNTI